jgi:hypothetical protein
LFDHDVGQSNSAGLQHHRQTERNVRQKWRSVFWLRSSRSINQTMQECPVLLLVGERSTLRNRNELKRRMLIAKRQKVNEGKTRTKTELKR